MHGKVFNFSELDPPCKHFRDYLLLSDMGFTLIVFLGFSCFFVVVGGNSVCLSSSFCVCLGNSEILFA